MVLFSEENIIEALRAGNEICIKMMFDKYYRSLCVYALKYVPTLEDAEDIVQNVFVTFWENKKGGQFEGSLRAYLFGAVAKASLKLLDKYNRFKFDDIEEHVNLFLEEIAFYEDEELNILKEKIEFEIIQLPEKSREVFKAVVLENLTYKQVAERYHISVNTVKTHYSNALRQLRRTLGKIVAFLLLFS